MALTKIYVALQSIACASDCMNKSYKMHLTARRGKLRNTMTPLNLSDMHFKLRFCLQKHK